MPDTYSRASQQRSLLLQEKVLNHLRSGGRLSGQVLESVEGPTLVAPIPAEPSPVVDGATTILPEQTSGMDVPFPDISPAFGDGHSDVLSDSDESDSAVSRDSISVISDLAEDGCWLEEFLVNMDWEIP